ncbi:hypothetical protein AVEN_32857-1 [Araneus ventricosus]|uniref:Uncharacterized protein n=1 Tax=Araneus ventricosus TaxID=182803 RepID=A0A4Y2DYN6_ARAVE|nr:hypothetical protein AVEN_32857-1 [Araneus ventricosus]
MKNDVAGKDSPDLGTLFNMLETKFRALESLGRTKEKFADFLEPLWNLAYRKVSCIPANSRPDSGRFGRLSEFYGRKVVPFFVDNSSPKLGCRPPGISVKKGRIPFCLSERKFTPVFEVLEFSLQPGSESQDPGLWALF